MKRFLLSVVIAGLLPVTGCCYRGRHHCAQVAGTVCHPATGCATTGYGPATIEAPAATPYDPPIVTDAPLPVIKPAPVTEPGETIPEPAPKPAAPAPAPAPEGGEKLKGPDGAEAANVAPERDIPAIETEETERVGTPVNFPMPVEN